MQPVEVKVGIAQPELYAAFIPSNFGMGAATACGVIPGIGILLAAACGGAFGAADASVNAERAKTADEMIRPLKDQLVDVNFDQQMHISLQQSLASVPDMQIDGIAVTKTVNDKAYTELFKASKSNAVMFVNVDYHLMADFSTLELSARGLLFPNQTNATTGAGSAAAGNANESALALKNASYRSSIFYRAKLLTPGQEAGQNIAAWQADNGRLLHAALNDGIEQTSRLLSENLQRKHDTKEPAAKEDIGQGVLGDLIWRGDAGSLLRTPTGALLFNANLAAAATKFDATRAALPPISASASGEPSE